MAPPYYEIMAPPDSGMMAPPDSEIIPPPCNGMIPPGSFLVVAGVAVGLIRSLLWQSKGGDHVSGADYDAPGARDYST
jgi:hypothetical protein